MKHEQRCENWNLKVGELFLLGLVFVVTGSCLFMTLEQPTVAPLPATPKRIVPRTLQDQHSGYSEQWRTQMQIDLGGGSLRHASSEALAVTNEALYVVGAERTSSDPLKSWQLIALEHIVNGLMA